MAKTKIEYDEIIEIEEFIEEDNFYDLHTETENFVAEGIITHNCTPHKKSCACGYFMPNLTKEMINVVVGIDVSGSIGEKEYGDFLSEVIGMAQAFRGRISIRFLTHDVTVHNDYIVENGNIEKIKLLKVTGGGGTSHEHIMEYITEKVKNVKLAIFLTDGYSDLENIDLDKYRFKKIFVIQQNGRDSCIKDQIRNRVIKLKGDYDE